MPRNERPFPVQREIFRVIKGDIGVIGEAFARQQEGQPAYGGGSQREPPPAHRSTITANGPTSRCTKRGESNSFGSKWTSSTCTGAACGKESEAIGMVSTSSSRRSTNTF